MSSYFKNPRAVSTLNVSAVALVQAESSGKALAEILNFMGEEAKRSPEWLQDFDKTLNEHGLCALREISAPTLAAGEPSNGR